MKLHDPVLISFNSVKVCDGRTDGRTRRSYLSRTMHSRWHDKN